MRGWMNEGKSYIAPVGIGDVMRAGAVGKVVASKHPKFAAGDHVSGGFGVQDYAALDGAQLTKIDAKLAPLPTFLNTLGMPGMTAYFGLLDVGEPKEGDTVVVSGAAGAVGATVGQIAKIKGCRAIGIAGGAAKCRYVVDELGFDAAIDYKAEDVRKSLRAHCPNGVNVYFDNSAATSSTSFSPNWRGMPASSSAAPFRNTTTRRRSKGQAIICRSWSTGRGWKGWSCSTMPRAIRKPSTISPAGSPPAS
jgi:NADPH-dependent curcumin reductase CurA